MSAFSSLVVGCICQSIAFADLSCVPNVFEVGVGLVSEICGRSCSLCVGRLVWGGLQVELSKLDHAPVWVACQTREDGRLGVWPGMDQHQRNSWTRKTFVCG